MNVVGGPAPKVRARSRARQWGLPVWVVVVAVACGGIAESLVRVAAVSFLDQLTLKRGAFVSTWIAYVGLITALVSVLCPDMLRASLAEYRKRFPNQSLNRGRWMRLPFLRWGMLYATVSIAATALGTFAGLVYGVWLYAPFVWAT